MENEFIPTKESLILKELGFDEKCFGFSIENENKVSIQIGISNSKLDKSALKHSKIYKGFLPNRIARPLFQEAFRWFREKYKIDSNINPLGINKRFYSIYIAFANNEEIKGDGNLYDVYEEAELACLRKLIEIVKGES